MSNQHSDILHAHVMPYYHGRNSASAWAYLAEQLAWYASAFPDLPVLVSESQWAALSNTAHSGGEGDVEPDQYATYWSTFDQHCKTFRNARIGWLIHTWNGEGEFTCAK